MRRETPQDSGPDAADLWREAVSMIYDAEPRGGSGAREVGVHSLPLGERLVARAAFSRHDGRRDGDWLRRNGSDVYCLHLFVSGAARGALGAREAAAGRGDILFSHSDSLLDLRCAAGETATFVLEREDLERACGRRGLHGLVIAGAHGLGALLGRLLPATYDAAPSFSTADAVAAGDALLDLVAAAVRFGPEGLSAAPAALLRERALDFIADNIWDPRLDAEFAAAALGVSRSTLYRLFEAEGGVADVIRRKRVHLVSRALTRSGEGRRPTLKELARRYGFSGAQQLTNAFRKHLGLSPSDIERSLAAGTPLICGPLAHVQKTVEKRGFAYRPFAPAAAV